LSSVTRWGAECFGGNASAALDVIHNAAAEGHLIMASQISLTWG